MYELKSKNTTVCIEAVDLLDYSFSWSGKYGFFDESAWDDLQEFVTNGNEWSDNASSFAKMDLMHFRSQIMLQMAEKMISDEDYRNELLADLEAEITDKVNELKTAENKAEIITVLDSLITERNKKAKLLK